MVNKKIFLVLLFVIILIAGNTPVSGKLVAVNKMQMNWFSNASAHANLTSIGVAKVGGIIWIITSSNNNPDLLALIPVTLETGDALTDTSFGGSDVDRYCVWKIQTTSKFSNVSSRARYNIDNMLFDNYYPLNATQFEKRYNAYCGTRTVNLTSTQSLNINKTVNSTPTQDKYDNTVNNTLSSSNMSNVNNTQHVP